MVVRNTLTGLLTLVIFVGAMGVGNAPVIAKEKEITEITVMAPRITRKQRMPYGETIIAEKNARVNFEDLDITRTADFRELEDRVRKAAERICNQLEDELPFGEPSTPVCINRAVEDAMSQVEILLEEESS